MNAKRIALIGLLLCAAPALSAPPCGKECKAKGMFKPNCLAKSCKCADKCDCPKLGRCCGACKCASSNRAYDAIERVNWQRAQRGLPPFIRDEGLTRGALAVAKWRADRLIEGHAPNDFGFLPRGVLAPVAGCAAWQRGSGFGACSLYENHRRCGAAWCLGRDGRVYCHAFYK